MTTNRAVRGDEAAHASSSHSPPPRHEYKFLVPAEHVARLREAVRPWCDPDRHGSAAGGYAIQSLYLDSHGLATYHAKQDRHLDRFKLRVRSYGDGTGEPIFLEVKRKVGDVVYKTRSLVPLPVARAVLTGQAPPTARPAPDVLDFAARVALLGAVPMALVRYRREAWIGALDPYARVTFDTRIRGGRAEPDGSLGPQGWRAIDEATATGATRSAVVLELKFPQAAPAWMASLARRLELWRVGFSKYCRAVDRVVHQLPPASPRVPSVLSGVHGA